MDVIHCTAHFDMFPVDVREHRHGWVWWICLYIIYDLNTIYYFNQKFVRLHKSEISYKQIDPCQRIPVSVKITHI